MVCDIPGENIKDDTKPLSERMRFLAGLGMNFAPLVASQWADEVALLEVKLEDNRNAVSRLLKEKTKNSCDSARTTLIHKRALEMACNDRYRPGIPSQSWQKEYLERATHEVNNDEMGVMKRMMNGEEALGIGDS